MAYYCLDAMDLGGNMTIEIAPGALLPIALVLGLLIGSFLNVVIHRIPLGISIATPSSHCPSCQTPIKPWHNVPLLSYLWLRGRCRYCAAPISPRYPAIELLTGLTFVAIALGFGTTAWTVLYWFFAAALIAAAMIDFDHQIIPDSISLGGLGVALVIVPYVGSLYGTPWFDGLVRCATGAAVGAGVLWGVAFLHARVSVALGRRFEHWPGEGEELPRPSEADYWLWFPGLGLGDVKLLGMIGAVVGAVGVLDTILVSSLIGVVFGLVQAVARGALGRPFGFAPAIAIGAIADLFLPRLWILDLF
jgi:leader peptidase (prepilin peptidase)/N-methyltransferase